MPAGVDRLDDLLLPRENVGAQLAGGEHGGGLVAQVVAKAVDAEGIHLDQARGDLDQGGADALEEAGRRTPGHRT